MKTTTEELWAIPRKLGIHLIPDLLPETWPRQNEFKLKTFGYCQTDNYSCGVVAGWCVLEAFADSFKRRATFKEFDQQCAPDYRKGTSMRKLESALRKHGMKVSRRKLNLKVIQHELQKGRAILTCVHQHRDIWHWIVIYGFGTNPNRLFVIGRLFPGFSRKVVHWRDLLKTISPEQGLAVGPLPTLPNLREDVIGTRRAHRAHRRASQD